MSNKDVIQSEFRGITWSFLSAKFFRKSYTEQRMIAIVMLLLFLISMGIRWLPFRLLEKAMGTEVQKPDSQAKLSDSGGKYDNNEGSTVNVITSTIKRLSRRVPWKSGCLVQAATGKVLLNRQNIPNVLYLGIKRSCDGKLHPHAWLKVQGRIVLGDHELDQFVVVSRLE